MATKILYKAFECIKHYRAIREIMLVLQPCAAVGNVVGNINVR